MRAVTSVRVYVVVGSLNPVQTRIFTFHPRPNLESWEFARMQRAGEHHVSIIEVVLCARPSCGGGAVTADVELAGRGGLVNDTTANEVLFLPKTQGMERERMFAERSIIFTVAPANAFIVVNEDRLSVPCLVTSSIVPTLNNHTIFHGPAAVVQRLVANSDCQACANIFFDLDVLNLVIDDVLHAAITDGCNCT